MVAESGMAASANWTEEAAVECDFLKGLLMTPTGPWAGLLASSLIERA